MTGMVLNMFSYSFRTLRDVFENIFKKNKKNKTKIQLSNLPHKEKTTKTKISTSLNDKDDDNLLLWSISFFIPNKNNLL